MTLILSGTDNSATTPAVTGTDTDTGIYYPTSNQVAIATNGTTALTLNASQAVGVGSTPSFGTSGQVLTSGGSGAAPSWATLLSGKTLIQVQTLQTGTYASGTTQMAWNTSPPQITGGTQFMSISITPTSASSILEIRYQAYLNQSSSNYLVGGVFQDSTANAIFGGVAYADGADAVRSLIGQYRMVAGTTSAITFRFRGGQGNPGGTTSFNGAGGTSLGGTFNSYLVVYEYAP